MSDPKTPGNPGQTPFRLSRYEIYRRYIFERWAENLELPLYERTEDNKVILHNGELYCRIKGCWLGFVAFNNTKNLRRHLLIAHECAVENMKRNLNNNDRLAILGERPNLYRYVKSNSRLGWYESLFSGTRVELDMDYLESDRGYYGDPSRYDGHWLRSLFD
ncbi:hypothetical protein N7462_003750 [Penicillium macrosclerotiorum]|uniref:uncharacterized protein n=1 Tax=Penicillium macrosclerotiorum TaxID=303699 RepID=UPI002546DA3E|nr:uncharacterized protein N7462_003750 [Penicillium macrosclerotiorum]KAJ5689358.1 hypothetical protein N7462_003750 [Penicillium macrosclerotiorum]